MRRCRVASCLASWTQQMNSLRASGVMSIQAVRAVWLATRASWRSRGISCTTPPGTSRLPAGPVPSSRRKALPSPAMWAVRCSAGSLSAATAVCSLRFDAAGGCGASALRNAAWTTSVLKLASFTLSPSPMSMARTVLLARRALKSRSGSLSLAPLGKVSLTASLSISPMHTMPLSDHTDTPWGLDGFFHFTSSAMVEQEDKTKLRRCASVSPRQSADSAIMASICSEGDVVTLEPGLLGPKLRSLLLVEAWSVNTAA